MNKGEAIVAPILEQHLGDTFPACQIAAWKRSSSGRIWVKPGGDTIVNGSWGWVDPETQKIPVTWETGFDLASITKLFTTTAFLWFVNERMVTLDNPLYYVIPEFAELGDRPIEGGVDPHSKQPLPVDPAYVGQRVDPRQVTFRHLLTHTSGLPPWLPIYQAAGGPPPPPDQPDPEAPNRWPRALDALMRVPFVGPPDGRTIRYSDIGLMLLGEAVARLGQADFPYIFNEQLFDNMPFTFLFDPVRYYGAKYDEFAPTEDDPTWRGRRVWGEVHDENACGVGGVAGHAGLFGDALQLLNFGKFWLDGLNWGRWEFDPALARAATSLQVEYDGVRRGLGFHLKAKHDSMAGDRMSLNSYGHSGFTGTSLWIDPDNELVVVILTNRVYPGRDHVGKHGDIHDFRRGVHDAIAAACGIG